MRFWQLFTRSLKETYRDPLALGFLLAFPLIFMLVFGAAFGSDTTPSYDIGIIDNDHTEVSQGFIDQAISQISIFEVTSFDDTDSAREELKLGEISAYVVIPGGFSTQVSQIMQGMEGDIVLNITYDESEPMISEQIISSVNAATRQFAQIEIPVTINTDPINIGVDITQMDFIATGIIVFGLLIMIPTSGRIMLRDKESRFLYRMLTTPAKPWEFIAGYSLSMVLLATIQIFFFILLGWLFGMDIIGSLWLAFALFLLTAICSIGIGMVVASLSKSENQGESLSWLFSMPLAILSGVWFSTEFMPSYMRTFAGIFPFSHAVEASRAVITRGVGMEAISGDFLFLVSWAAVVFIIGTILFSRTMRS
ncbi:MAG: ABC transporter permease [Dehalococcoidia bacterium]|nr:MAG: ABC transporter permease [Dehalococcoidia bacterium]